MTLSDTAAQLFATIANLNQHGKTELFLRNTEAARRARIPVKRITSAQTDLVRAALIEIRYVDAQTNAADPYVSYTINLDMRQSASFSL